MTDQHRKRPMVEYLGIDEDGHHTFRNLEAVEAKHITVGIIKLTEVAARQLGYGQAIDGGVGYVA